jgi:hypothetical protein
MKCWQYSNGYCVYDLVGCKTKCRGNPKKCTDNYMKGVLDAQDKESKKEIHRNPGKTR